MMMMIVMIIDCGLYNETLLGTNAYIKIVKNTQMLLYLEAEK